MLAIFKVDNRKSPTLAGCEKFRTSDFRSFFPPRSWANMIPTRVLNVAATATKLASSSVSSAKQTVLDLGSARIKPNSTVFSMIQPTGVFHVGNYLGAVRSWVDLQESCPADTELIFGVADLHALTVPKDDPSTLRFCRRQAVASMIATGIDPDRCIVYQQSHVAEHTRLYWFLSTVIGMGYMNRMSQWKSKANLDETASLFEPNMESAQELSKLQLGLFAYPALQAADILLYKSNYVPVGEDQSQHLELTRHITAAFNRHYPNADTGKSIFPEPKTIFAPFKKVASLRDPSKKMSKSDPDPTSCVYIPDSPDRIAKCIRRAVTDSIQGPITFDPVNRPGIANLLVMASGFLRKESGQALLDELRPVDHKHLKDSVAEILIEGLRPVRERYNHLMTDLNYIDQVSARGADRARAIAKKTLIEVERAIGMD